MTTGSAPCPVCRSSEPGSVLCEVTLASENAYDLVECGACGVRRFDPLPGLDELREFYSGAYYDFERHKEEGKGRAFARSLSKWRRKGRFLDVGCATGFFLNGVKAQSAWDVYGVEFGADAVRVARDRLGLDVRTGELPDVGFDEGFFDYIHVNNVLEHVRDPVALLGECRRIIKPDGKLYLSVPNGRNDSLDLIAFHESESRPARSKSGHIFFFAAETLLRLFDELGFEVEKKRTYSLKRGMRSAGWLPRKKDWKRVYDPRMFASTSGTKAPVAAARTGRRYPDVYYRYRFLTGNLKMMPGLHDFGLDFLFMLRPASPRRAKQGSGSGRRARTAPGRQPASAESPPADRP